MELYAAVRSKIEYLEPFVISECINDWKAMGWTHQQLAEIVKPTESNGSLRIRLGPKEHLRGKNKRDWNLTGNMYKVQGLESIPSESSSS
ncbi:hypothetical protein WUBG_14024 [Wuchereria bancrofti]|uniref:Uncharacterized protein n=1 Tax=Wuchereria bancrofti TaxID=6293 RepID=J9EI71_WUCBA|nr:hypothetical protein WUBG_14024 [Wuchereria bancrofti]